VALSNNLKNEESDKYSQTMSTSRLDTLPAELVDKIMGSKKMLEMQDVLTKLRKPVDHTDLPLKSDFPYTSTMKRIWIDTEYLDIFHERHFYIHYTNAIDDVVQTLARFDGFERNHIQSDGSRAYVADRITQICGLLATKFGIQDPMEAEIVARRMCDKRFAVNHHDRLRGLYTRYKNLFDRKDFTLRYYNDIVSV
tara:strand:+ start:651 stop:1238 length:588 start_codon:yes stop_codon:yes gene_type:complete